MGPGSFVNQLRLLARALHSSNPCWNSGHEDTNSGNRSRSPLTNSFTAGPPQSEWVSGGRVFYESQRRELPAQIEHGLTPTGKFGSQLLDTTACFSELRNLLGDRFTDDEAERADKGIEQSGYAPRANPDAVVFPESTEELSQILAVCNRHEIPITAYGGGTSVEGQTVPVCGGVVVDLALMTKIIDINELDEDVVVQAGIGWIQLNDELRPKGFFVTADPGPGACVGGMCGTGCSGTNAVRYGTMKDQVLNLTVVLADGTIVKTRRRARKSSAGYDLARLFIGSEGTLGIISEVTLKMRPIPPVTHLAYVNFPSVSEATAAVTEILQRGIQVGAVELCDEPQIEAINSYSNLSLPAHSPLILFKMTGRTEVQVRQDVEDIQSICSAYTQSPFQWIDSVEEQEAIWEGRKQAFWACQAQYPGKRLMATDVAVPISRLAEIVTEAKGKLLESKLYGPIVGHVGDGNFHVSLVIDSEDPAEMSEAIRFNQFLVARAIEMDGTCTGEHGIGLGKKKYLEKEVGRTTVTTMRRIKNALDPKGILNPGKLFDAPFVLATQGLAPEYRETEMQDSGGPLGQAVQISLDPALQGSEELSAQSAAEEGARGGGTGPDINLQGDHDSSATSPNNVYEVHHHGQSFNSIDPPPGHSRQVDIYDRELRRAGEEHAALRQHSAAGGPGNASHAAQGEGRGVLEERNPS